MSAVPGWNPAIQPLTLQETREWEASVGGRGSFVQGRGLLFPGPAPFSKFNEEEQGGEEGLSPGQ